MYGCFYVHTSRHHRSPKLSSFEIYVVDLLGITERVGKPTIILPLPVLFKMSDLGHFQTHCCQLFFTPPSPTPTHSLPSATTRCIPKENVLGHTTRLLDKNMRHLFLIVKTTVKSS